VNKTLGIALLVSIGCSTATPPKNSEAQQEPASQPLRAQPAATQSDEISSSRDNAISRAASRVAPSVVSVNVTRRDRGGSRSSQFQSRNRQQLVQGFGSGFVVSSDGLVITNQHVTTGAVDIVVTTRDGTDYPAELLGEDPHTDIAILKIDGEGLPFVELGVSTDLRIGEWVVAFGNPYAYLLGDAEPTVTAGVVSAVGRNLIPSGDDPGIYVGMIQTDAAINPGNSGGPLTNSLGQVVGVNSSIFSNSGGSIGIGFAIPIERAIRVANELRSHGSVRRAWTGLTVTEENMRDWKQVGGLRISEVVAQGPASNAGLRPNDVIVSANDMRMRTFLDWEAARLDIGVGDTMQVVYMRGSRRGSVELEVEDLPTADAERVSVFSNDLELVTLTPAIRAQYNLVYQQGALILNIGERTAGATGLRQGDLIMSINRARVTTAEDVPSLLQRIARGRRPYVQMRIERNRRDGLTDFRISQ
jgi:serine protease Do